MTRVVDLLDGVSQGLLIVCDFSPPRGPAADGLEPAKRLDADFISVNYSPGRSTRVDPIAAASWLQSHFGKDTLFTIATRDMNRLALQSHLLGAALHGLENVTVLAGDPFPNTATSRFRHVDDFTPTQLIRSIRAMNDGIDYRGMRLDSATRFCVGAAIDIGRGIAHEAILTKAKLDAGAQYFLCQPTFSLHATLAFIERFRAEYGEDIARSMFHGVQVLGGNDVLFGSLPDSVTRDIQRGRPGVDIAIEMVQEYAAAGLRNIYLIPPIRRGGQRDYDAAGQVIDRCRSPSAGR